MQQYFIGLDIGTGSTKAVALNKEKKTIAVAQIYYAVSSPQPGYSEEDPEVLWQAFVSCIHNISDQLQRVPDCVSISSAMHTLLAVDDKNQPLTPLIIWEDTRSALIAADLRKSPLAREIYEQTGTPIHSMSPLCKIKWIRDNEPSLFAKVSKFISIKEFFWYRLFAQYEVDYSIASATGLFNIHTLTWNPASLDFSGLTAAHLSTPVPTDFTRNGADPAVLKLLSVSPASTFCIGASDGCLANLGSDALRPGTAAVTIGTSGAVRVASARPITDYDAMIFNYVLDEHTFISGGPVNNGGNVLKWMFKTFLEVMSPKEVDYQNIFQKIDTIPAGSQGLLFLPYLFGERAPIWDEKASAAFIGIQSFHTNAHFLRASVEGICFGLKNILDIVEEVDQPIGLLQVSGGFVHSDSWMQILADVTGKSLRLAQAADASAVGAALMGMQAMKMTDACQLPEEPGFRYIQPAAGSRAVYEKIYGVYKKLYGPLKTAMHDLCQLQG